MSELRGAASVDEQRDAACPRWTARSLLQLGLRPEITSIAGCAVAFAFFAISAGGQGFLTSAATRNYLQTAAEIGIIVAPATLLLVAGEFDLSVGSVIAFSQVTIAYLVVDQGWPLIGAIAVALVIAMVFGAINGILVVKTGLPSFIVTLAGLYWISGLAQGLSLGITGGTVIGGFSFALNGDPLAHLFSGNVLGQPISVVWWVAFTLLGAWVLYRTRVGNWIYAAGGNPASARQLGVPVHRLTIALYMCTSAAAVIVGTLGIFVIDQGDATAGSGMEFEVVLAAVVGGALLTGGFGSPIGSAFGALLYGLVVQGFFFTNIPDVWYTAFLGVMLLVAVFINRAFHRVILRTGRRW